MNIFTLSELEALQQFEDDTKLIQTAIDKCAEAGGGRVVIPSGRTYVIGGIMLKSNVELHLASDALLLGNGCEDQYIQRPGPFERIKTNTPISALVYAKNATNVSITGTGRIDGNYEKFILEDQENAKHIAFFKYPRPMVIYMEGCSDIAIKDITLTNAPFWTVHLVGCDRGTIRGVKIYNEMRMPNTDGFDIDRCKNFSITDCIIETGDDAICPKCTEETAEYGDCENVVVKNCRLKSASSAIKFGSSSFGTFRNFTFEHIEIKDSNRGLAFQLRDTKAAENISFRDISISTRRFSEEWWGTGEPIYVTVCQREDGMEETGSIKNIVFENITCVCENGILLYTDVVDAIKDVTFRNVALTFQKRTDYLPAGYDLRPCRAPIRLAGKMAPLVAVNVNGLHLEQFTVSDVDEMLEQSEMRLTNCRHLDLG